MRKAVGLQQANTVSAPPTVYLKGVWKQPSQHQFCWLSAGANTSLPSPQHPFKWSPSASPAHIYPTRGSHSMGRDTQNKKHSPRWCWASQGGDDVAPSIYVYTDGITFLVLHQKKTFPLLSLVPPYHINSSEVFSICSIALKQTVKPNLGQDIPSQCPSKHVVFSPPITQLKWRFSLLLIQYYHHVLNRVNS